jgi:hypothetical protein
MIIRLELFYRFGVETRERAHARAHTRTHTHLGVGWSRCVLHFFLFLVSKFQDVNAPMSITPLIRQSVMRVGEGGKEGSFHLHLHLRVMGEVKTGGLFEYPYQSSGGLEEF